MVFWIETLLVNVRGVASDVKIPLIVKVRGPVPKTLFPASVICRLAAAPPVMMRVPPEYRLAESGAAHTWR